MSPEIQTRPVYLVRTDDGYIARDEDGPALLVVVHTRKEAGRFSRDKAKKIAAVLGCRIVRLIRKSRILRYDAPAQGFACQWWRCRTCGIVMRYIYQPYSLSNPIITTCHGTGYRDYNCDTIPEEEALRALRKKWDRVVLEEAK